MKQIYSINVSQEIETEEPVLEKDSTGTEIKVIRKVKKEVPRKFFIRRPTRSLYDSAALFASISQSNFIRSGVLSGAQLSKRYNNDQGVLSDTQLQEREKLYSSIFEKQTVYSELNKKPESERTEEEKKKISTLLDEMVDIMSGIQGYENYSNALFNNTAESMAQTQTIRWWLLHLAYEETAPDKYKAVFGDGSYEEKLKVYDDIEEKEDVFDYEVVKKLYLITTLFVQGKATKKEDFDVLLRLEQKDSLLDKETSEKPKESLEKPAAEEKKEPVEVK